MICMREREREREMVGVRNVYIGAKRYKRSERERTKEKDSEKERGKRGAT